MTTKRYPQGISLSTGATRKGSLTTSLRKILKFKTMCKLKMIAITDVTGEKLSHKNFTDYTDAQYFLILHVFLPLINSFVFIGGGRNP